MQSHKDWLLKANQDLRGAKVLLREDINDLAVYHSHQCAEKALKGFLAFKLVPVQKTHDLVLLAEQCLAYDPSFDELRSTVEFLNPLGTLTRYPSEKPSPSQKTTESSIEKAESLLQFIRTKIKI